MTQNNTTQSEQYEELIAALQAQQEGQCWNLFSSDSL